MLNVPDAIKALYKRDDIRKNFRVQFPNGEYSDITNADVVQESVRFTESIGSQDVFRFGLSEASVLEFETVGIGNMYSMTISAFTEIDTSSLTAAQISAIQSDPGDGTLVLEGDSDIGWGFYRIPLGVFLVDSCPRNHGAMTHRRVTAYAESTYFLTKDDPIDRLKMNSASASSTLTFGIRNYVLSKMALVSTDILTENNLVSVQFATYNDGSARSQQMAVSLPIQGSTSGSIWIRATLRTFSTATDHIYGVTKADTWDIYDSVADAIEDYATEQGIVFKNAGQYPTVRDYIEAQTRKGCSPFIGYRSQAWGSILDHEPRYIIGNDYDAFYTYGSGGYVAIPTKIEIAQSLHSTGGTPFETFNRPSSAQDIIIRRWEKADSSITDPMESVMVSFKPTEVADSGNYTYVGVYNAHDLVSGFFELKGIYGKQRRVASDLGAMQFFQLDPSSPATLNRSEYEELWWDEYDVEPIGTIYYCYKTAKREMTGSYSFGDGTSVYDMSDNAVLANMANASASTINALLEAAFIPNVGNVVYTPIDLSMRGYPWLEAGDCLELTAEDGVTVTSYMMRRELSGIQALSDDVTASGGEIIEGGVI